MSKNEKQKEIILAKGKVYSGWNSWNIGDFYSYEFVEFIKEYDGKIITLKALIKNDN